MNELTRCTKFLSKYGWRGEEFGDYISYVKDGEIGIDINETEIVFVGGDGDFLHLPCNFYALVGALITHRIIPYNYSE